METVKSSEALEAQILEDARAKARRVVETGRKEADAIRAEAEKRTKTELARLDAARDARLAGLRADLEASVPLDVKRLRLAYFQQKVAGSLGDFFQSLAPGERDTVIGGLVARAASAFAGNPLVVGCAGIAPDDARRIVMAAIPGAQVKQVTTLSAEEAAEVGTGVIVETADRSRRLRATLKELTARLLEDYREQLLKALFGKDVQT